MATHDELRDELAGLAVTLRDLETTLGVLAQGLTQHPPHDLTPVLAELASLKQLLGMSPRRPARWPWLARPARRPWLVRAVLLGLGLWAGSVVWDTWQGYRKPPGYSVALLRDIDQVLVTNYKQISQSTQEKLHAVYTKAGVPSPGQRQKR